MDTLELCGDILQPGGQLETPGLVLINAQNIIPTAAQINSHSKISFIRDL